MPQPVNYNGIPLFVVNEEDFIYIVECSLTGGRLLSKNIHDDELRDYYINARKPQFAVSYDDVVFNWGKHED